MLQVAKLHHLKILNLPHNCLSTIEGLKDLKLLTWLGLSGNRICTIDSLSQNIHLEHLDLSDNKITRISDISYLKNLKVLYSSIFLLDKTIYQAKYEISQDEYLLTTFLFTFRHCYSTRTWLAHWRLAKSFYLQLLSTPWLWTTISYR